MNSLLRVKHAIASLLFLTMFTAPPAGADALGEFYLWEGIRNDVGKFIRSYKELHKIRKEWRSNIEQYEAKLKICGEDCPEWAELEAKRSYWQRQENYSGDVVRSVLGQFSPTYARAVGKLLGVNMGFGVIGPGRRPGPEIPRDKVVVPESVKRLPQQCQDLNEKYTDDIYKYRCHGGPTGFGKCKDSYRLFSLCAAGDMKELERHKNILTRREAGIPTPSFEVETRRFVVSYGDVPGSFVPKMPPHELILSNNEREFVIKMRKQKTSTGALNYITVHSFRGPPGSETFQLRGSGRTILRADVATIRGAHVIRCHYFSRRGNIWEVMFWYVSKPAVADPERLTYRWRKARLSGDHPINIIGKPRTDCPGTRKEAMAAKR